jgi:hypothetical protein
MANEVRYTWTDGAKGSPEEKYDAYCVAGPSGKCSDPKLGSLAGGLYRGMQNVGVTGLDPSTMYTW